MIKYVVKRFAQMIVVLFYSISSRISADQLYR